MKRFFSPALLTVLFLIISTFSCKSYPPNFKVSDFYSSHSDSVTFTEKNNYIVLQPAFSQATDTGIIFYPGGRVNYKDYLPLMTLCAQKGITCVLVKMPFDFAVFDISAARKIIKQLPEIKNWYMAGHSLGGAMAAAFISRHKKEFNGLILLAAYTTHNLSASGLRVLSIYGSRDGVLNMKKYQKYKKNLPAENNGLTEYIIEGGNHAQFANYGAQKGDFGPDISVGQQQKITAEVITVWVENQ